MIDKEHEGTAKLLEVFYMFFLRYFTPQLISNGTFRCYHQIGYPLDAQALCPPRWRPFEMVPFMATAM